MTDSTKTKPLFPTLEGLFLQRPRWVWLFQVPCPGCGQITTRWLPISTQGEAAELAGKLGLYLIEVPGRWVTVTCVWCPREGGYYATFKVSSHVVKQEGRLFDRWRGE